MREGNSLVRRDLLVDNSSSNVLLDLQRFGQSLVGAKKNQNNLCKGHICCKKFPR